MKLLSKIPGIQIPAWKKRKLSPLVKIKGNSLSTDSLNQEINLNLTKRSN